MLFCLQSLKSSLRLGGTSPVLRLDRGGEDRECLYIETYQEPYSYSKVDGKVIGLDHLYNNQPFEYGCFSESCFVGSGIWSIARSNEVLDYLSTRELTGCLDDCVESFNPVCRIDLPYDYSLPHLRDEQGKKFIYVDVNDDYCKEEIDLSQPELDLGGFELGEYLEGTLSLYTYTRDGITLAISFGEGCTFVYLLIPESQCFDDCSLSRLRLLSVYGQEGTLISSAFIDVPNSPDFSTSYQYLSSTSIAGLEILIPEVLDKHLEVISFKREYLTRHKCFSFCNSKTISIDSVEIVYNNANEVWVEGLYDGEYVYTVDAGYIHPFSNDIIIWDRYIPLESEGRFKSRKVIPGFRKVIQLRRTNRYTSEIILNYIEGDDLVLRTSSGHLLTYNKRDQRVDIEDLSLSIINILLSQYSYRENCQEVEELPELDRDLLSICSSSISFVNSLISREVSTKGYGSIPKEVATYSSYNSIYKNPRYLDPVIRAFESGVFSDDCYLEERDQSLIDRSVDNRSICWFIYAICTYIEVTSDRSLMGVLDTLCSYLINQTNHIGLLRKGLGEYGQAIDEYEFSYSALLVLALMRAHDITSNIKYIDQAADTYLSLDKYLRLPDYTYSHSYADVELSEDSLIYGLLYSLYLNKEDSKEILLKLIQARSKPLDSYLPNILIVSKDGTPILSKSSDQLITRVRREEPSIVNPSSLSPIYTKSEFSNKLLYLLDTVMKSIGDNDLSRYRVERAIESQVSNRDRTSLILLSYCLDDEVVGHPLFKSNSLYDLEHLLFHRRLILEKLLRLPLDYTWFDKSSLTKEGVTGSILYTMSLSLSNWYVGMRRFKDGLSLSRARDSFLYRWGNDLGITRLIQEDQTSYSGRLRNYLNLPGVTKDWIRNALLAQGLVIDIDQPTRLGFNGLGYLHHSPDISSTYLQGSEVNPSTIVISTSSSITTDEIGYIETLLPAGVKARYEEILQFISCDTEPNLDYIEIDDTSYSFTYEVLCCPSYNPCLPIYVEVDLGNVYNKPIYVYGVRQEAGVEVQVSEEHRMDNLIGVIKSGISSQVFRVEAFR